jgi:hypothetical protein
MNAALADGKFRPYIAGPSFIGESRSIASPNVRNSGFDISGLYLHLLINKGTHITQA